MIFGITVTQLLITVPLVFMGGLLDAISGGGGLISLPAYLIAGVPPHMAVGTNKLSAGVGLLTSTGRYLKDGLIDKPLILPSVIAALVGAALGARLNLLVSEDVIRYMLLLALPLVAFMVFRKRDLEPDDLTPLPRSRQILIVTVSMFGISIYDGFYGPGSGTFMLLALTQFARLPVRIAEGNFKIIGMATCVSSIAVYGLSGNIFVPLALITGVSSMIGHYIGAELVIRNGARIVRPIVLFVLALLFVRVILEMTGIV